MLASGLQRWLLSGNREAGGWRRDGRQPHLPRRRYAAQDEGMIAPTKLRAGSGDNHVDGARSVTDAVYNQHEFWAEKRAALMLWEAELRRIIAA